MRLLQVGVYKLCDSEDQNVSTYDSGFNILFGDPMHDAVESRLVFTRQKDWLRSKCDPEGWNVYLA